MSVAQRVTTGGTPGDQNDDDDISDVYPDDRQWVDTRIQLIREKLQPLKTPVQRIPLPPKLAGLELHIKKESEQPSGSHKHRLAEALLTNALASGQLTAKTPAIEASSGSTAVSEAWYCQQLGIEFYAVVPESTSKEKLELIKQYGGTPVPVKGDIVAQARALAVTKKGYFLDQFTYAERAYDWRGEHGLAPELLGAVPELDWFVMGAGTGGTATSVGRYARYAQTRLRVCVTDPDHSAYFRGWRDDDRTVKDQGSRIEGIGRPEVEPSFLFPMVNRMIQVHDAASVATMRVAADAGWGIKAGPSTGTGLFGAIRILLTMQESGRSGKVATLMCDSADRYQKEYYDDAWLKEKGIDYKPWVPTIEEFFKTGDWHPPVDVEPTPRPATVLWNM
ncbi:PLP-dependent cysteine synthase family protein [Kitasatospora sp. NPDC092286]|uniref:PLP-dependent cysteine synthase family protein n=1 Tax=Kitasatospora sp. NPDC092286 TaxID=3364087 RepID=UPI00382DB4A3